MWVIEARIVAIRQDSTNRASRSPAGSRTSRSRMLGSRETVAGGTRGCRVAPVLAGACRQGTTNDDPIPSTARAARALDDSGRNRRGGLLACEASQPARSETSAPPRVSTGKLDSRVSAPSPDARDRRALRAFSRGTVLVRPGELYRSMCFGAEAIQAGSTPNDPQPRGCLRQLRPAHLPVDLRDYARLVPPALRPSRRSLGLTTGE